AERDPEEALAYVLRESGAGVQAAQNLLVIKSEPGTAPNVGRAVDEWGHNDVVGTVAGDDTVLMVLGDSAKAGTMGGMLNKMIQET
ncbi:MAG: ArgR family transcriptional regulator, partial [Actinomycetota bacterium]